MKRSNGPEDGPVQHDRPVRGPVLADVLGAEALRQHEIDLQGAALPVAADGVPQHELELRAVEGALARVQRVVEARRPRTALLSAPSALSQISSLPARLAGRSENLTAISVKAEVRVDALEQVAERDRLRVDLVLGAEDVRVVLRERAHAHQAVQRARGLVAVAGAELGHAQRQVAIDLMPCR